jgi:hypothetical protein
MKIEKIKEEISREIIKLESKKDKLHIREMKVEKREKLWKEYDNELDKLYKIMNVIKRV